MLSFVLIQLSKVCFVLLSHDSMSAATPGACGCASMTALPSSRAYPYTFILDQRFPWCFVALSSSVWCS